MGGSTNANANNERRTLRKCNNTEPHHSVPVHRREPQPVNIQQTTASRAAQDMQQKRPVIAIAGLACETSTFSPARTRAPAFHPRRGNEIIQHSPWLHPDAELGAAAEWHGILTGHALPGGTVTREAFDGLAAEIEAGLQTLVSRQRLDGVWLDIHGAMCVEDMDDSEAVLLDRIRRIVGPGVLVSASMDLHGNVSRRLVHQCDLITCYRTAPHVDVAETRQRACRNLLELLSRRDSPRPLPPRPSSPPAPSPFQRPYKAWVPIPVLLPGEQTSTRIAPADRIYAAVPGVEADPGVIDAAIWVGYCWADEPRNHAVVVVTGWDATAVATGAETLARLFWSCRREFHFVAPTGSLAECLDAACAPQAPRPYFISDSGDNPTAGGAGDVTWTLHELVRWSEANPQGPVAVYASIPGGEGAVREIEAAGVGGDVSVTVGAEVDDLHAGPVSFANARVHAIKRGDKDAVVEAALQVTPNLIVIVTQLRKPYHHKNDFTDLRLDFARDPTFQSGRARGDGEGTRSSSPRSITADLVVVKIGYLEPELYALAEGWMLALTPGGVDQDLARLGHARIQRPMWPFDEEREDDPDLSARFIPAADEVDAS